MWLGWAIVWALVGCGVVTEPVPDVAPRLEADPTPAAGGPDVLSTPASGQAHGGILWDLVPMACAEGQRGGSCVQGVQGGTYWRGAQAVSPDQPGYDPHAQPDEAPVRQITVSTLWMQASEVSAAEFQGCITSGLCSVDQVLSGSPMSTLGVVGKEDFPAVGVSWDGAVAYCSALGGRLPTEAEWEWVARGTEQRTYPWGDAARCPIRKGSAADAVTSAQSGQPTEEQVDAVCGPPREALVAAYGAQKVEEMAGDFTALLTPHQMMEMCESMAGLPPDKIAQALVTRRELADRAAADAGDSLSCSLLEVPAPADGDQVAPAGVLALAGSVWEWTSDAYAPDAYGQGDAHDPTGPAFVDERVQRGGSFMSDELTAFRSAARGHLPPSAKLPDVGFRCAWDSLPSRSELNGKTPIPE